MPDPDLMLTLELYWFAAKEISTILFGALMFGGLFLGLQYLYDFFVWFGRRFR